MSIFSIAVALALVTASMGMTTTITFAQVPEHCGFSQENACAVPDEEDAQKILEVFPDAIVIVDEELYESIPEDDRKNADEIIEAGAREEEEEDSEEEDTEQEPGSQSNGFQIDIDECMAAGNSRAACEAIQKPDFGICGGLNLAGVPCPVEQGQVVPQEEGSLQPNHINECMAAGNSRAACEAIQKPDFGICEGLALANVPCPVP